MPTNTRILVVDDDQEIRELLEEYLTKSGFDVSSVGDGVELETHLQSQGYPDLILLDVMLPGDDGFTLCQRVRKQSNVPIIMLTAVSDETDQIIGLEIGADDYMPKPFNPRELLARIKAVLRRRVQEAPGAPSQEENVISFGDYQLNLATREMLKGDVNMPLTSGEFAVLKALITHPREPLSRDKLMNLARGRDYSALERSIDVQVSRLRRMLEEDPAKPRYIQTVWGLGYVFVPEGKSVA